jgi:hypothetical protein
LRDRVANQIQTSICAIVLDVPPMVVLTPTAAARVSSICAFGVDNVSQLIESATEAIPDRQKCAQPCALHGVRTTTLPAIV